MSDLHDAWHISLAVACLTNPVLCSPRSCPLRAAPCLFRALSCFVYGRTYSCSDASKAGLMITRDEAPKYCCAAVSSAWTNDLIQIAGLLPADDTTNRTYRKTVQETASSRACVARKWWLALKLKEERQRRLR